MISLSKTQEIERLLSEEKFSQRKIAKLVGVSRATVAGIADGTRPDYAARDALRQDDCDRPLGPLVRCPDCGGRIYAPCRLCRVRRIKAAEQAKRLAALQSLQQPTIQNACNAGAQQAKAG